jgi:DNA-binding XRE family transcriptional regulator
MTFNLKQWRSRLDITQEKAAELLGVHRVTYTNWETGANPIDKSTKLAASFCEIAYIAADQFVECNPSTLNNIGSKNLVETLGKAKIINGFIDEQKNVLNKPISIICHPQSFIQRIK